MFRVIAFIGVCMLSAAVYLLVPGVPVPTETLHKQAQALADRAEAKVQEIFQPESAPPATADVVPPPADAPAGIAPIASGPVSASPTASAGQTATIYARIVMGIERDRGGSRIR